MDEAYPGCHERRPAIRWAVSPDRAGSGRDAAPRRASSPRRTWRISSSSCCVSTATTIELAASPAPGARSCSGQRAAPGEAERHRHDGRGRRDVRRGTDTARRRTETWHRVGERHVLERSAASRRGRLDAGRERRALSTAGEWASSSRRSSSESSPSGASADVSARARTHVHSALIASWVVEHRAARADSVRTSSIRLSTATPISTQREAENDEAAPTSRSTPAAPPASHREAAAARPRGRRGIRRSVRDRAPVAERRTRSTSRNAPTT